MKSRHWVIDLEGEASSLEHLDQHPAIIEAAEFIKNNEVIAFPTETVYGLGGNALSEEAVNRIFTAKGRPSDNPLIIHLYDQSQLPAIVSEVPELAKRLFSVFAPGPLTIILKGNGRIAQNATAGLDSVGIRFPDHPVARALLKACDLPLAAPSANRSGRPSPTHADHVLADLDGRIAGVLDAGGAGVGVESTVIDLTVSPPMILRPGGISREQLKQVIGTVTVDPSLNLERSLNHEATHSDEVIAPRSPGMKYRHYAPDAPLWIVDGDHIDEIRERLLTEANRLIKQGKQVGILTTIEGKPFYLEQLTNSTSVVIEECGRREDLPSVARELYDRLRKFNESPVEVILAEAFPKTEIGSAIMNRLDKAAGGKYL